MGDPGFFSSAAFFPGTKSSAGNPSLFAEYDDIPFLGNQSKMELFYQEKEFATGCMSGREMSGSATTAEKHEVHASRLLLRMLCCARVQIHLLSAICIHLA